MTSRIPACAVPPPRLRMRRSARSNAERSSMCLASEGALRLISCSTCCARQPHVPIVRSAGQVGSSSRRDFAKAAMPGYSARHACSSKVVSSDSSRGLLSAVTGRSTSATSKPPKCSNPSPMPARPSIRLGSCAPWSHATSNPGARICAILLRAFTHPSRCEFTSRVVAQCTRHLLQQQRVSHRAVAQTKVALRPCLDRSGHRNTCFIAVDRVGQLASQARSRARPIPGAPWHQAYMFRLKGLSL